MNTKYSTKSHSTLSCLVLFVFIFRSMLYSTWKIWLRTGVVLQSFAL